MSLLVALVFGVSGSVVLCQAHVPAGTVYPAFQWPEDLEPVMDGDLSEWDLIPDRYVLKMEHFFLRPSASRARYDIAIDPSNFSVIRCIVGWNQHHNRLYFAAEVLDDMPRTAEEGWHDYFDVKLDADHSGGQYDDFENEEMGSTEGWYDVVGVQATWYRMYIPSSGDLALYIRVAKKWAERSPWAEYGWRVEENGERGGVISYELSLMPFDTLSWRGLEQSKMHGLEEGEIIGLTLSFVDYDDPFAGQYGGGMWSTTDTADDWKLAERLGDFLLAPVEGTLFEESTVEQDTWGRIKTTFRDLKP